MWLKTHHPLHIDKAKALADVVADDDNIRAEEVPVVGTRSVVQLYSIKTLSRTQLENEGLIRVAQEGNISPPL